MQCEVCQLDLPPEAFGRGRKSSTCLNCRDTQRKCRLCGEIKPQGAFGGHGRHGVCRACRSVQANRKYHANAEARAWQVARSMNASLAKRTGGGVQVGVSVEEIAKMILAAEKCVYCGSLLTTFGLAVDHVVPHCDDSVVFCRIIRAEREATNTVLRRWNPRRAVFP